MRQVMRVVRHVLLTAVLLPGAAIGQVEPFSEVTETTLGGMSEGWVAFGDVGFLFNLLVSLVLATVLSAIIGFHPRTYGNFGSPTQLDKPKSYVIFGVVGAIIGTLVLKYGPIVGLVVFGIGGLLRFRTNFGSPAQTGMAILVTLIGLCCGLNLPHVAVLTTVFGFVLIYVLESRRVYSVSIKGLAAETLPEAAQAYRKVLADTGCLILGEQKNFTKQVITIVFRSGKGGGRETMQEHFATRIPPQLRGSLDWTSG